MGGQINENVMINALLLQIGIVFQTKRLGNTIQLSKHYLQNLTFYCYYLSKVKELKVYLFVF